VTDSGLVQGRDLLFYWTIGTPLLLQAGQDACVDLYTHVYVILTCMYVKLARDFIKEISMGRQGYLYKKLDPIFSRNNIYL
jgi:hypothetical protein